VAVGAVGAGAGGGGGVTFAAFLWQPASNNTPASDASKANVLIFFCVILFSPLHSEETLDSLWSKGILSDLRKAAKEMHNQDEPHPAAATKIEGFQNDSARGISNEERSRTVAS
jgi:hypothetical protein